jgi:uncharacterized protein
MSLSTGRAAIELALARTSKRLHLIFFGGEPLLRWPSLVALTEYARTRTSAEGLQLHPSVTTNGTRLSQERANFLRDNRFVTAISCDGCQQAHDCNRLDKRGGPSHARTVEGIRVACETGLRVRAILVLDPLNVHLLVASVTELRSLGVRDIVINPNWAADWAAPELRARWTESYEGLAGVYVDAYRNESPLWISVIDTKIQSHIKGGMLSAERCDLGRRDLVVAPSGNLYPCDRMVGEDNDDRWVIGHVSTGTESARVDRMVQPATTLPVDCVGCALASRCRNRCACANLAMTGALSEPSDTLCFHEQLSVRVADDAAERLYGEKNDGFIRRHYRSEL